jgi:hypothetical protein
MDVPVATNISWPAIANPTRMGAAMKWLIAPSFGE